jgi:hypothetical protein
MRRWFSYGLIFCFRSTHRKLCSSSNNGSLFWSREGSVPCPVESLRWIQDDNGVLAPTKLAGAWSGTAEQQCRTKKANEHTRSMRRFAWMTTQTGKYSHTGAMFNESPWSGDPRATAVCNSWGLIMFFITQLMLAVQDFDGPEAGVYINKKKRER